MKYERLTKRDKDGKINVTLMNAYYIMQAYERFAELEDKIESGKILELPCKVGDTIWILNDPYFVGEIFEMEVLEIHLTKKHIIVVGYHECETFEAISQFVFRTKEQAEARLKELQGE